MNRDKIIKWARQKFGTEPEYLWKRYPGYAVLRNTVNRKWYAAIMDVPKNKLGFAEECKQDVIDVKCDPILIGSLRGSPGFLPAYHMNKDSWITILLDGTVPEEQIKSLISMSYELTYCAKGKKR